MPIHVLMIHPKAGKAEFIKNVVEKVLHGHIGRVLHAPTIEEGFRSMLEIQPSVVLCAAEWKNRFADMIFEDAETQTKIAPFIMISVSKGKLDDIMNLGIDTDRILEYALRSSMASASSGAQTLRTPRVIIHTFNERLLLDVQDILYGKTEHNTAAVYMVGQPTPISSSRSIRDICDNYQDIGLLRISRDMFVNVAHIARIKSEGKSLYVSMRGVKDRLSVTDTYRIAFNTAVEQFAGGGVM